MRDTGRDDGAAVWSVIVDSNDVSEWFGEYLEAFAACGWGESDAASLLAIQRGDYQPGRKIPSEATLMQQYDLARETVSKAFRVLADEGLVEVVQGRGVLLVERS